MTVQIPPLWQTAASKHADVAALVDQYRALRERTLETTSAAERFPLEQQCQKLADEVNALIGEKL